MKIRLVALTLLLLAVQLSLAQQPPSTAQSQRSTLPPSWTPSATPTITPTPTATAVPSLTPTRSPDDICDGFTLLHDFTRQDVYLTTSYVPIVVQLDDPTAMLRFSAVNTETNEGNGFELPGGQALAMEFRLSALPGPGDYDWRLVVVTEAYGELCALEGQFSVLAPTATPLPDLNAALTRLIERILGEAP